MIQKSLTVTKRNICWIKRHMRSLKRNWMSIWQRILPIFWRSRKNITDWSIKDGSPYLGKKPKSIWKKEMRQKKPVRSIGKWITFLPIMGPTKALYRL